MCVVCVCYSVGLLRWLSGMCACVCVLAARWPTDGLVAWNSYPWCVP